MEAINEKHMELFGGGLATVLINNGTINITNNIYTSGERTQCVNESMGDDDVVMALMNTKDPILQRYVFAPGAKAV